MTIQDALKQRILILDGAMGTMIQRYNLSEATIEEDFLLTIPKSLKAIMIFYVSLNPKSSAKYTKLIYKPDRISSKQIHLMQHPCR